MVLENYNVRCIGIHSPYFFKLALEKENIKNHIYSLFIMRKEKNGY